MERYHRLALEASVGLPALRAFVLAEMVTTTAVIRVERIAEAGRWALEARSESRSGGAREQRLALHALAWTQSLGGNAIDDVCDEYRAVSEAASYITVGADRIAGQRLVWRGDLQRARELLTRLFELADERGEPYSYALLRLHLCEVELRAGAWDAATRLLDEWAESSDRELVIWPMYERCRALVAAGR